LISNEEVKSDGRDDPIDHQEGNSSDMNFLDHQSLGLPFGC
jgi:hypothetical protein